MQVIVVVFCEGCVAALNYVYRQMGWKWAVFLAYSSDRCLDLRQ
jgi:Fe2+ transport system protein B